MFNVERKLSTRALKKRMRNVGLSYRKAAPLAHAHHTYISDILNGRRQHPGWALRARLFMLVKKMEAA
ncbi:MAG: helix-turn-helix domain-containing protein [Verrucomicrobia bacterium]|nr:helix-turn-helix domain-containing protein [Verrucomicrobiota bacterium]